MTAAIGGLAGSRGLPYLASLLPEDAPVTVSFRVTTAAFHLIVRAYRMFAFWLQCDSVVYFAYGMHGVLERMESAVAESIHQRQDKNRRIHIVRTGKAFSRNYRELTVLQAHYAGFYKHYIGFIQAASILGVSFYTYVAVIRGSVQPLLVALATSFGHTQLIKSTAQVYETSSDVLRRWRQVHRRDVPLWFPRYLKSCRIVYVPIGSFFYMDRGLVLTVLSMMTNGATTLILGN